MLNTMDKLKCNKARVFFKLFNEVIVSMLLYALEILGLNQITAVEKIYLFVC